MKTPEPPSAKTGEWGGGHGYANRLGCANAKATEAGTDSTLQGSELQLAAGLAFALANGVTVRELRIEELGRELSAAKEDRRVLEDGLAEIRAALGARESEDLAEAARRLRDRAPRPEADEVFTLALARLNRLKGVVERLEQLAALHDGTLTTELRAIAAYTKEGIVT